MENGMDTLRRWVEESRRIVFFGGAGVSTESGIPDFRSEDGLYRQKYRYPPETMLSHDFFEENPEEFYRFYREKILIDEVEPNAAHRKLAEWERQGKLCAVVTQNIDGLHQKAGSRQVWELHGSIWRNYCTRCGKRYPLEFVKNCGTLVPRCSCGGIVRPDVVLYGEMLDQTVVTHAVEAIASADLLLVGGTSLVVYPAAGLLQAYHGSRLTLINRSPTPVDRRADLLLSGSIGELLSQI